MGAKRQRHVMRSARPSKLRPTLANWRWQIAAEIVEMCRGPGINPTGLIVTGRLHRRMPRIKIFDPHLRAVLYDDTIPVELSEERVADEAIGIFVAICVETARVRTAGAFYEASDPPPMTLPSP